MKLLSAVVLALALLGSSTIWLTQPVAQEDPAERRAARQRQQAEQYEIDRARRDAFASFVDDICAAVEAGNLQLAEASDRILTYTESFYPAYLRNLDLAETGASPQEKIARNLLRYFINMEHARPERFRPELIARLESELTAYVRN